VTSASTPPRTFVCRVCRREYVKSDGHNCLDAHTIRGLEVTRNMRVPQMTKAERNALARELRGEGEIK
jgi:hypothetical protein